MALIPTTRQIRRRIEAENSKSRGLPKLPASAQVDSRTRRVTIPGEPGNLWNGVQVSQYNVAALVNLTSGKKAAAGE